MTDQRERRLLALAVGFLFLYSVILSLAPAVREQTWAVSFRLSHWPGFAVWAAGLFGAHMLIRRELPERDPYLLPLAGLLSGWGLLTVWRLEPGLGARQAVWLLVSLAAFVAIPHYSPDLRFLRRYKYLLLGAGLLLTALTLLLGTNPAGAGPRLWLGCCGFYFQPSEPLKLLLVVYLSAYLADRLPLRLRFFPMLLPTIFVTGLALLLLIVQRDLGTASIFILLYTAVLFVATDMRRVLLATGGGLALAGLVGFFFIDIVHARLEAWINPWNDPSGRAFQIVQSLLAIANGGVFGRGPGIGNPGLVPVAHSDFIFATIAEELGMAGSLALLAIFALLIVRGILAALRAQDEYRRLLALGASSYLGLQALVIIGGNLRMLPLTGVTLPFVSYGGSSLLTSFVALSLIATIGGRPDVEPAPLQSARPFAVIAGLISVAVFAAALIDGWWAVVRSPTLLARTDNPRRAIADRYVPRGAILDRNSEAIDHTSGTSGDLMRVYSYPPLAPIVGYTHRVYGEAGLEAALDDYLRGLQGNPQTLILWDNLLYGTPPPGLDVRLSLELDLQMQADALLGQLHGAVVLLNAQTGEVLAMASHPGYDPNQLDKVGASLAKDTDAPLLNRAAQAAYPLGSASYPFLETLAEPEAPRPDTVSALYNKLGFYTEPQLRMPVAPAGRPGALQDLRVSPLQMALAAAALGNGGIRPAARIALAVETPQQGWVILPALDQPALALAPEAADQAASKLTVASGTHWQWVGEAESGDNTYTWYVGGTAPNWRATPLALAVLIEGSYPLSAQRIGEILLQTATRP